jgi:3-dehydroquinate synthase
MTNQQFINIDKLKQIIDETQNTRIIVDENVFKLYSGLFKLKARSDIFLFKSNESLKTTNTVLNLVEYLLETHSTTSTTLIAIGGGICLDTVGFVASMFMRGISFISVPTTLLAMVDASIGGKVGVNFMGWKNIVGSMYSASVVYVVVSFLDTLSDEIWYEGYAEVVKHEFLMKKNDWDKHNKAIKQPLFSPRKMIEPVSMIKRSVGFKQYVVEQSKINPNSRHILNFGHTFAHALETVTKHQLSHGLAVFYGFLLELRLFDSDESDFYNPVLNYLKPIESDRQYLKTLDIVHIVKTMTYDKKNSNGQICFSPISVTDPDLFRFEYSRLQKVWFEVTEDLHEDCLCSK